MMLKKNPEEGKYRKGQSINIESGQFVDKLEDALVCYKKGINSSRFLDDLYDYIEENKPYKLSIQLIALKKNLELEGEFECKFKITRENQSQIMKEIQARVLPEYYDILTRTTDPDPLISNNLVGSSTFQETGKGIYMIFESGEMYVPLFIDDLAMSFRLESLEDGKIIDSLEYSKILKQNK